MFKVVNTIGNSTIDAVSQRLLKKVLDSLSEQTYNYLPKKSLL